jgi:hypothetical protein
MPDLTQELRTILEQGKIEVQGQFLLGSNYTFLVNVTHAGQTLPAVYKPSRGEQPLWDFPEASLAGREVAAYLVSEALGFHFIPFTTLRDGPFGPGSLQQFIDYDPNYHYFNFKPVDRQRLRPVAVFDLLVNNADRKGGHILFEKRTRRLFVIDHGLCFHEDDKLRTVLWDFAGEAVSPDLLAALDGFRLELSGTAGLHSALGAYLTRRELTALSDRADRLVVERCFPRPPADRRAFPYPPV